MKSLIATFTFALATSAFAGQQKLETLSCTGANGLKLRVTSSSNVVTTQLGYFAQKFETNRSVVVHRLGKKNVTRVSLGLTGKPDAYVYDIFLTEAPKQRQKTTLKGVIGYTVNTVSFEKTLSPVIVPVGFVPLTTLNCNILTR